MIRDIDGERPARIDMVLEEFRLNHEDLVGLAAKAREVAGRLRQENRVLRSAIARFKARKK